uniref:Uncharacterized protein n=1 Tax=Arundo donax TaxID=35708 RepID=A0A0A9EF17_ARUDO
MMGCRGIKSGWYVFGFPWVQYARKYCSVVC